MYFIEQVYSKDMDCLTMIMFNFRGDVNHKIISVDNLVGQAATMLVYCASASLQYCSGTTLVLRLRLVSWHCCLSALALLRCFYTPPVLLHSSGAFALLRCFLHCSGAFALFRCFCTFLMLALSLALRHCSGCHFRFLMELKPFLLLYKMPAYFRQQK